MSDSETTPLVDTRSYMERVNDTCTKYLPTTATISVVVSTVFILGEVWCRHFKRN